MSDLQQPLQLTPQYRDYVWGGMRLRPGLVTAEAWVVYDQDRIAAGPFAGRSLAEFAAERGQELLGRRVVERTGDRFPLLVKLLDCAQWLSLQVHPNDEQAKRMEGPGHFGKTEAWHILEAAPGARLIAGIKPGTTAEALADAIRQGGVIDKVTYHPVRNGDTVFMPAGMIHALGPGLLIYEVQQTSDITYRVFDWNRPASAGRPLHIEQSLAVTNPTARAQVTSLESIGAGTGGVDTLVTCPYFSLRRVSAEREPLALETGGETFHAITVTEGAAAVNCGGHSLKLRRFETAVIPAAAGCYDLTPDGPFRALVASVD